VFDNLIIMQKDNITSILPNKF